MLSVECMIDILNNNINDMLVRCFLVKFNLKSNMLVYIPTVLFLSETRDMTVRLPISRRVDKSPDRHINEQIRRNRSKNQMP